MGFIGLDPVEKTNIWIAPVRQRISSRADDAGENSIYDLNIEIFGEVSKFKQDSRSLYQESVLMIFYNFTRSYTISALLWGLYLW